MDELIERLEAMAKEVYGDNAFITQNNFSRWLIFRATNDRVVRLGNIFEVEDFLLAKLAEKGLGRWNLKALATS